MSFQDRIYIENRIGEVYYRIGKRFYDKGEFTNFVFIQFPFKGAERLHPYINEDVFYNVFDLVVNYVMKKKHYDISPVFISPSISYKDLPLYNETKEGERLFDSLSSLQYTLNTLYKDGELLWDGKDFSSKDPIWANFLNKNSKDKVLSSIKEGYPLRFFVIHPWIGFLDPSLSKTSLITNSHFFLMELSDLLSHHSLLGEPIGGLTIDNKVKLPYMFNRSSIFLYKNGKVKVKKVSLSDLKIVIDNIVFQDGKNCKIYSRPDLETTPRDERGNSIAIVNNRLVGYKKGGGLDIPDGGFVIHTYKDFAPLGQEVAYKFSIEESVVFSVQGGPWLIRDREIATFVDDPFYKGEPISFPPTVFPAVWGKKHAARVGLGIDEGGRVSILFVQGTNENTYIPGFDSKGFTLSELAETMYEYNAENAINLDGGGSAQVYLLGGRFFTFSERRGIPGLEFRRPVPIALKFAI